MGTQLRLSPKTPATSRVLPPLFAILKTRWATPQDTLEELYEILTDYDPDPLSWKHDVLHNHQHRSLKERNQRQSVDRSLTGFAAGDFNQDGSSRSRRDSDTPDNPDTRLRQNTRHNEQLKMEGTLTELVNSFEADDFTQDKLDKNQSDQDASGSLNSKDATLSNSFHQKQVLSTAQKTQQHKTASSVTDQEQNFQQLLKKPANMNKNQDSFPKRAYLRFSNKPKNIDQQQQLLSTQKTPLSSKRSTTASRKQYPLPKPELGKLRLEGHKSHRDEPNRLDFFTYLLKCKQKAVLHPGCHDRGIASHVTSLAFVKVHKSASTTVANILARYALRHTLNIALPWKVVFNHMVFNRDDLEAFMPNGTFYFAIMRDPLDRFVSSFSYYGFTRRLIGRFRLSSVKDAIMFFIKHPKVLGNYTKPEVYNSLAGDTGLPPELHTDAQSIKAHIEKMETDLDLIMIVEYFDESLVMLKRRSCLSMQDIVYVVKNVRSQKDRMDVKLTPEEMATFNEFQMADVLMYQHFYKKFWRQVYAEGPDFFSEVLQFKEIQRTVTNFCSSVGSVWDFVTVPSSAWNEEFVVTARECRLMSMSELNMQLSLINRAVTLYRMSKTPDFPGQ